MESLKIQYSEELNNLKNKLKAFTMQWCPNPDHHKIEKVNRKIANVEAIIARIETGRIKFSDLLSKPRGVHTIVRAKMPWEDEDEPEHPPAVDVDELTDDEESGVDVDENDAFALLDPTYLGVYYEGGRYHADFRIVQYKTIVAQVVFPLKPRVSVSESVSESVSVSEE
jgi:hypothetical protein